MAARKTAKAPATPARKVGPRSGFTRVTVALEPKQLEVLQDEAMKRMRERGSLKPDAGEVVREAIAAWVARRR